MRRASFLLSILTIIPGLSIIPAKAESPAAPSSASARGELLQKLRDDLKTASENANLTADQRRSLEAARTTLTTAVEARRDGDEVAVKKVRVAFTDIRKIAESDAFRPQDREAIQEDLRKLRELQGDRAGQGSRGRRTRQ